MKIIAKKYANIFSKLNEQLAFHGSKAEFEKFNSDKIKEYRFGWGFYFTRSESYASDYGNVKQPGIWVVLGAKWKFGL